MACTALDISDICLQLCLLKPATGFQLEMVQGIPANPTEIQVIYDGTDLPCASTYDFGNCNCPGGGSLGIYTTATQSTETCNGRPIWILGGLINNLPSTGCDLTENSSLAKAHPRTEKINIGNPTLHIWACLLCKCLDALRSMYLGQVATVAQLDVTYPDPLCGQSASVVNGGNPLLYVAVPDGSGSCVWKQGSLLGSVATAGGLGSVALACPPVNPALPIVYNQGCPVFDNLDTNASVLNCGLGYTGYLVSTGASVYRQVIGSDSNLTINTPGDGPIFIVSNPYLAPATGVAFITTNITSGATVLTSDPAMEYSFLVELLDSGALVIASQTIRAGGNLAVPSLTEGSYTQYTGVLQAPVLAIGNPYSIRVTGSVLNSAGQWDTFRVREIIHDIHFNPTC